MKSIKLKARIEETYIPEFGDVVDIWHSRSDIVPWRVRGVVLKSYEDGRFFVKLVKGSIPEASCDGWSRYGIEKNEGMFISTNSGWCYRKVQDVETTVIERVVYTKTESAVVNSTESYYDVYDDTYFHKSTVSTIKTLIYYHEDDPTLSSFVFTLLVNKNIGGICRNVSTDMIAAEKIAYLDAVKRSCERQIKEIEQSVTR